ncbi:MAG TPA: hypothetical protein VFW33_00380 [Gemmataceae bacterium]|nr:hypothetical protein [Gemmataceae bacterium]
MTTLSAGLALWNQRHRVAARAERARAFAAAVGRRTDLTPYQWAQLLAFALEFRPDLIIELGRERGNSTCCFLEAAELLEPEQPCRLLSLCLTDLWQRETRPRLEGICSPEWFARGDIRVGDLLAHDFRETLAGCRRCLIFWDAHGFDVAECVLGHLLPQLSGRRCAVVMHDMTDLRYDGTPAPAYGPDGLWKGGRDSQGTFWLGHVCSHVAQAVSVIDFTTRNRIPLRSAAEELHAEFAGRPDREVEAQRLLGADLFGLSAHWFWFSADDAARPVAYPPWNGRPHRAAPLSRVARTWRRLGGGLRRALLPAGKE